MKRATIIIIGIALVVYLLAFACFRNSIVSYENTGASFFYLATSEHLYLLASIEKMETRDHVGFAEPQFGVSYPKQLLYLLDISTDGKCRAFSFEPPKMLESVITIFGIKLVKCNSGLALFDCYAEYWFDGEKIGEIPPGMAKLLSDVFEDARKDMNWRPLDEWNQLHGVIGQGEVRQINYTKHSQLDWKQHHFEISYQDAWPDYYRVAISAPTLWQGELLMKVPFDYLQKVPHPKTEPGFSPVEWQIPPARE